MIAAELYALFISAAIAFSGDLAIQYPRDGAVFPPEFPPPTFLWNDSDAKLWTIDIALGESRMKVRSLGERPGLGPIDPRCVSSTNKPPQSPAQHAWKPDAATWAAIKKNGGAVIEISGSSRARTTIRISPDPVAAPIFYRDVPLMPAEGERGVIRPLAKEAIPMIAWRLRNVGDISSRLLMTGIHSCANCHSASTDGKTMGMDLDGPRNDKGLYAIFNIRPQAAIRDETVIAWSTFQGKLGGKLRVGFMSQISPDSQYVVTTINDPGPPLSPFERKKNPRDLAANYYVANFKDYRFLQVFYPTRGILAWYSRATGRLTPLPGADDPRYVHTNAVWSPDGKYLVFARAEAQDAYGPGRSQAEFANDPNETQIRYDLYRIPFNGGKGGRAEPIAGASANGMSNSFPKISPDGRWIVFVQAKNAQLMRPDGRLFIVPAEGGQARLMQCNTALMNSWHSFSPNGRWMVFSSKARSPYTQMYLTHIGENGEDTPPVLIEDATAANRAVNIPEFLNIAPNGLLSIAAPVTDYYRWIDVAEDHLNQRRYPEAIAAFRQALALSPDEPMLHNSLGVALARTGSTARATEHYRKAIALSDDYPDPHANLGAVLIARGDAPAAAKELERALQLNPDYAEAHSNLGTALAQLGRLSDALSHFRKAVDLAPDDANSQRNLALALMMSGSMREALPHAEHAVKLSRESDARMLNLLGTLYAELGRTGDSVRTLRRALAVAAQRPDPQLTAELKQKLASLTLR